MQRWLYRTRAGAEPPIPATSMAMELARSEFPLKIVPLPALFLSGKSRLAAARRSYRLTYRNIDGVGDAFTACGRRIENSACLPEYARLRLWIFRQHGTWCTVRFPTTFRCDAPARCGALAEVWRILADDNGGRGRKRNALSAVMSCHVGR